jgi:hypothetical protein
MPDAATVVTPIGQPPTAEGLALKRLLHAIFDGGDAAAWFVVLRNGEPLPDRLGGNDLDISVMPDRSMEEVVRFVRDRGRSVGWEAVCVSRRLHMMALSLVDLGDASAARAVHFDVFDGISSLGVRLVPPELLRAESRVRDGVRELSDRGRVLSTVVHHIASSGALTKNKYAAELAAVLRDPGDRTWLLTNVHEVLGPKVAAELTNPAGISALRTFSRRRKLSARRAVLATAARHGESLVRVVTRYTAGQLPSMLRPPGVIGCPGDWITGLPGTRLTPELACRVAPLAALAPCVRSDEVWTLNSPKHAQHVKRTWMRLRLLRWTLPSLFLWLQAKRNRVVVVDRLPFSLRVLRRIARPQWLAAPGT